MYSIDFTANLKNSLDYLYPPIRIFPVMKCVEIGSFEGRGSVLIHNHLCKNKDSILYCIDPFDDEYVKGSDEMSCWNHLFNGQYIKFKTNTSNLSKIIEMRGVSNIMIPSLEDNSIDFCYIDGDHSPDQVYKDIVNMFGKMKNGSIVLFDDYLWESNGIVTKIGIDRFLNEYIGKYDIVFQNYQLAIRIKK
jgi:predicted O-methyltransferase YrrM